jgi:heat shock protein HslJ
MATSLGMAGAVRHVFAGADANAGASGLPAPNPAVSDDLEGHPWLLARYAGPGGRLVPVIDGTEITATFANDVVSGMAGCNDYNAGYRLAGNVLRVSPIASTRAQCFDPPGIMQQEAAYFAALQQATRVDAASDALSLHAANGATLLEYVPQPQASLEGTVWTAINYNNGQGAIVSVKTGTTISASFAGRVMSGSAGCNTYQAGYALNGDAITIQMPASTFAYCADPPGVMDQETAYLAALPTAERYRIDGALLILERTDGARVATYTAGATTSS